MSSILDDIQNVKTPDQARAMQLRVRQYLLEDHPDNDAVRETAEMLVMLILADKQKGAL